MIGNTEYHHGHKPHKVDMGVGGHYLIDIAGPQEHQCTEHASYQEIKNADAGITGGHKVGLLVCRPERIWRAGSGDALDEGQEHVDDKYNEGSRLQNGGNPGCWMDLRGVECGEQKEGDYAYDPQIGKEKMGVCKGGTVEPLSRKHGDDVVCDTEYHHGNKPEKEGVDRRHNKGVY